ncbi:RagB/SusD family nutrient uptake outer membrane protein [Flavihumibacter petaseus]|nr:RagB/SusD family nutrient uptake outer membrane protein [Flavihumibacter petaseus]
MKHLKHIAGAGLIALLVAGCSKDKLDKLPQGEVSQETFWTTEKEARLALNACYNFVDGTSYNAWYNDGFADNAYCQYPWESNATAVSAGNINAATIDMGYDFTVITRCNNFLTNIGKVSMDEDLKKRYIAEARALRAYRYFLMSQYFGAMPLVTETAPDPSTLDISPKSQEELFSFITTELGESSTDLPESYPGGAGTEVGRVTRWAALALKARAHLYHGDWSDAAATAKLIMESNQFKLFRIDALTAEDMNDDYSGFVNFADDAAKTRFYKGLRSYEKQFWAANENNPEVILDAGYILNDEYYYSNGLQLLNPPAYLGGWSSIEPTQDLVDAYWEVDGTPFTPPSADTRAANFNSGDPNPAYYNEFKNRDTRLYASILFPGNPWNYGKISTVGYWDQDVTKTGYNFRKLVDPNYVVAWTSPQNFQLIRYAEVLLTFAEAQNEAVGPDSDVFAALNDIRDRVGMPAVDASLGKDALREVIRNERRIELAEEGFRYDDMRRWNLLNNMHDLHNINNQLVQERKWVEKYKLLPYPQAAVDRNPLLKDAQAAKGY